MNREALDRWCERGILGLVLAILIVGPLAFGATRAPGFSAIEGLTIGVLGLWAVRLWANPHPQLLWPPICWAVLAFVIYGFVRYLHSDIEYVARQEFMHVVVYALLFFAILNNLHGQESVQIISVTLVMLAMGIAFYALFQFVTGSTKVWTVVNKFYPHRATGTYFCPNHLGGFLEMILPLGLTYMLASRVNHVTKIILGYASLVILAGIAVTVSRGSWISTSVAVVVLLGTLAFNRKYRIPALALLVLLVGGAVYIGGRAPIFQKRLKQIGVPERTEFDSRVMIWKSAIGVWQDNPWWGAGPGHFDFRFGQHRPVDMQLRPVRVHNDFLNALADWGIVGEALIASAWGLLAWGVVRTWPHVRGGSNDLGSSKGRNKYAFVLGASVGLLAIFVHSAVDFNMYIPANAILAVTLMALLSSYLRFATERYWFRVRLAPKLVITGALACGMVCLAVQGSRQLREYQCLAKAAAAPGYSPEMIAWFTKAFEAEPTNPDTAATIGECYRVQSAEGGSDYQQLAEKAMDWFGRSIKLNPWRSHTYIQYGRSLDWVGKTEEAQGYFDKAVALDPNNYYTLDAMGMHYVELQDYAAARVWFERSKSLEWEQNPVANSYLEIVQRRLSESAAKP
jgi:O-antigen ligase